MKIPSQWLDQNGLVIPQPSEKPADNGVLFTSIAVLLGFEVPDYEALVRSCYLKPGLVARWPGNNFDQAAWDDYLGVAVACIFRNEKKIPREILSYAIRHAFFFNTDGKLQDKDFLLRNFPIWPLMICAAFPIMRLPMWPLIWLVQSFFKYPNLNDTSGFQLQWVYLYGCALLGFNFKRMKIHEYKLKAALRIYYHTKHPFNDTSIQNT